MNFSSSALYLAAEEVELIRPELQESTSSSNIQKRAPDVPADAGAPGHGHQEAKLHRPGVRDLVLRPHDINLELREPPKFSNGLYAHKVFEEVDDDTMEDDSLVRTCEVEVAPKAARSIKLPNSAVKLTPITVPVQRLCVFLPIEEQNHANPEDAQDNHDVTAAVDPDESQPLDPRLVGAVDPDETQPLDPSLVGAGGPDDDDPQEKVLSSCPGVLHSPRHARSTGSMTQAEPATADS